MTTAPTLEASLTELARQHGAHPGGPLKVGCRRVSILFAPRGPARGGGHDDVAAEAIEPAGAWQLHTFLGFIQRELLEGHKVPDMAWTPIQPDETLSKRIEEIAKQVEAALKHEVERFDFEAEVRKRAHGALGSAVDRALNDHFQYGEGQRLVSRLVADAIARITPPEARRPRQSPDDDGCGVPGEGEV